MSRVDKSSKGAKKRPLAKLYPNVRIDFFRGGLEMPKLSLYGLIVAACTGCFGVADAAYLIKLKNGNEYVTSRYWHDGGQVMFDTYDGVFGIAKSFVSKIEKTDQVIKLATARDPGEKFQADKLQKDKEPDEARPATESKKREPDDPIVGEFKRLKEKSKEVDGMLTEEIRDLLKEIKAFKDKMSGDSKLFIEYGREFNDIHQISSAVEAAFNARR